VNRWTTDGFRSYVGDLQSSVDRQLEASVGEQAREAEDAFFWVTHYERGFWDMAMSGRPTGIQLSPVRPHAREPIT
jgi:thiaminase